MWHTKTERPWECFILKELHVCACVSYAILSTNHPYITSCMHVLKNPCILLKTHTYMNEHRLTRSHVTVDTLKTCQTYSICCALPPSICVWMFECVALFVCGCVCLYVRASAQLLTADCISLVWTVCTLWFSVTAPPSRNTLSILASEVCGRTCLLCCGDRGNSSSLDIGNISQIVMTE